MSHYLFRTEKQFTLLDHNTKNKVLVTFKKFNKYKQNDNKEEQQYLHILDDIIRNGHFRKTRNSNTWSIFDRSISFDLNESFPLITTKKVFLKGIFEELLWFLKGDSNSNHLVEKGVKIWEANTSREFLDSIGLNYDVGDTGEIYSHNWRYYSTPYTGMNTDYQGKGFDQIEYCLNLLKKDPYSRRIMFTSYNPSTAHLGVLYPCHSIIVQFYVDNNNKLNATCYNRSQDFPIGSPFNFASSSLLLLMFIEIVNNNEDYKGLPLTPGKITFHLGDIHVYEDHYSQVVRQIMREPYKFPKLKWLRKVTDITDFKFEDIELNNYKFHSSIPYKMVA